MPHIPDDFAEVRASSSVVLEESSNTPVVIRILVAIGILVAAIVGFVYFLSTREQPKPSERRERSVTVDLMAAQPGTYQPDLGFFGEIVAATQFDVRPAVAGAVVELHPQLRAGGEVQKGDVLLKIDPFNYEGALTEAEASLAEARLAATEANERFEVEKINIESAKAQLDLAQKDVTRAQRLNQRGTFTDQQVETRQLTVLQREQALAQSESNLNVLRAQIEQRQAAIARAEWRVAQANKNLEDTTIMAPFDAVVQSETIEVGRLVTSNEVIASLFDVSQLEARFVMTDKQFGELSASKLIGRDAEVRWQIDPEPVIVDAEIVRSGALVDAGRGGVDVFAAIQQDSANPLRPGTFVQIEVKGPQYENAFLLPESALYDNNFVYVREEGRIAQKKVRFIGFSGEQIVVQSDEIGAGDEIITTRLAQISEGLKVLNEQEAAQARAKRAKERAKEGGDGPASKTEGDGKADGAEASKGEAASSSNNETAGTEEAGS